MTTRKLDDGWKRTTPPPTLCGTFQLTRHLLLPATPAFRMWILLMRQLYPSLDCPTNKTTCRRIRFQGNSTYGSVCPRSSSSRPSRRRLHGRPRWPPRARPSPTPTYHSSNDNHWTSQRDQLAGRFSIPTVCPHTLFQDSMDWWPLCRERTRLMNDGMLRHRPLPRPPGITCLRSPASTCGPRSVFFVALELNLWMLILRVTQLANDLHGSGSRTSRTLPANRASMWCTRKRHATLAEGMDDFTRTPDGH